MSAHAPASDTAVALANAKIHRTATLALTDRFLRCLRQPVGQSLASPARVSKSRHRPFSALPRQGGGLSASSGARPRRRDDHAVCV